MQANRKWPVLTVIGVTLVAMLAVILRLRGGLPQPVREPDMPAPPPTPATDTPPSPPPTAPPEPLTPFQRDMQAAAAFIRGALDMVVVRWLVFGLLLIAAVIGLTSLKPPVSTLVLVLLVAGALEFGLASVLRSRWLHIAAEDAAVAPGLVLVARFFGALALVLMTGAAYGYLPANTTLTIQQSTLLLLAGVIAAGLSIWLAPQPSWVLPLPTPSATPVPRVKISRGHWVAIGLGLLALVLVGLISSRTEGAAIGTGVNIHLQLVLLLGGFGLFGLGLVGVRWPRRWPSVNRWLLVVLLITALGLFLRFWHLGGLLRNFVDEVNFTVAIVSLIERDDLGLVAPFSSIAAFPFVFPYMQSLSVEAFGRNLFGLRAVSAIMGALTIPGLYVLARTLFDRKTAIIAALLLATFPAHIHFSRLGLNNIADPLMGTWALAFFARGLVHHRRVDYIIGGMFLGLTHYFYEGGRLLYTPLVIAWLGGLALLWGPHWRGLRDGGLAAVGFALPIYVNLILPARPIFARSTQSGAALSGDYWRELFASGSYADHIINHVIPALLMYVGLRERSMFYNADGLMIAYAVPLFLLGLAYALWRLRSPGPLLLVLWVAGATVGNTLMVASDHTTRFVVVFPALALLIAVGLRYGLPLFLRGGRVRNIILVMVTAVLVVAQVDFYFNRHLPTYARSLLLFVPHRDAHDALLRSMDFPACAHIHIIDDPAPAADYMGAINNFLNPGVDFRSLHPDDFTQEYIDGLDRNIDHAFFVEPDAHAVINLLYGNFDLLPPQMSPHDDVPPDEQYALLYAPRRVGSNTCRPAAP